MKNVSLQRLDAHIDDICSQSDHHSNRFYGFPVHDKNLGRWCS